MASSSTPNGYSARPDDPRLVAHYAATEAIATSSGQNDSGMFELNFRDERYLPFEFAGAVSHWRIELPPENNFFDVETASDVILHLNYTAQEGGEVLRRVANEVAQQHLPGAGLRIFDVRREFPDVWQRIQALSTGGGSNELPLRLTRSMFPYLPSQRPLRINRLELFFEASGAYPSSQQRVEFLLGSRHGHTNGRHHPPAVEEIPCVASDEWPGFYHGVLDLSAQPLDLDSSRDLGILRFPIGTDRLSQAFLFCGYETTPPRSQRKEAFRESKLVHHAVVPAPAPP